MEGPKPRANLVPVTERETVIDRSYPILEHNSTTIYLTPFEGYANNYNFLEEKNILFIVNVSKEKTKKGLANEFEGRLLKRKIQAKRRLEMTPRVEEIQYQIEYYRVPIDDAGEDADTLYELLPEVTAWIDEKSRLWQTAEGRFNPKKTEQHPIVDKYGILIHCALGQCRSVSVLTAFLMRYGYFRLRSALQFVECVLPTSNIRHEFMIKLKKYEEDIYGVSSLPSKEEERFTKEVWKKIDEERWKRINWKPTAFKRHMEKKIIEEEERKKAEEERKKGIEKGEGRGKKRTKRRYRYSKGKVLEPLSSESSEEEEDELVEKMGAMRVSGKQSEEEEEEEEDFDFLF